MADQKVSQLTNYTPAVDTDVLPIVDTTTATTKKITWANIKATLKTYFDTLYPSGSGTSTGTNTGNNAANSNYESDYRPGGADVAIADGGTGASTALAAMTALAFQSKASAYRSTAQAITTGTFTKVQLNAEDYDTSSEFDSVTNYRFTATVAGYYSIKGQFIFDAPGSATLIICDIRVNNSSIIYAQGVVPSNSTSPSIGGSRDIYLNATDYVEMFCYQNSGSNKNIIASGNNAFNFLTVHRFA